MWETTSPPAAPRSIVNTGIPAALAFSIDGTIASASVGLTRIASTPCWIKSSMLVASVAGSSCESTMTRVTPADEAAASAPSFKVTKNGLFRVDRDRPRVYSSASATGSATDSSSTAFGEQAAKRSNATAKMLNSTRVFFFIFFS